VTTLDDDASEREEHYRAWALNQRKPAGPPPCGACYNCGEELPSDLRFCDEECRDDWEKRR